MTRRRSYLAASLMTAVFAAIVLNCADPNGKRSPERKIAEKYCSGCHAFPEPELLTKKIWLTSVLPVMGPRLGIYRHLREKYPAPGRDMMATPAGTFPEEPLLTTEEWEAILTYYGSQAPDSLPDLPRETPRDTTALFAARFPDAIETEPATMAVYIDSSAGRLVVANAARETIGFHNSSLERTSQSPLRRPVVHIEPAGDDAYLLTDIGSYFPSDFKEGAAWVLPAGAMYNEAGLLKKPAGSGQLTGSEQPAESGPAAVPGRPMASAPQSLIPMLGRPTQVRPADLDTNGKTDYVVCAYGLFAGELAWYPSPDRKYVIHQAPGALQAEISDVNNDGRPDIWALFAQGDESLYLFTNRGGKGFKMERLLRFPPSYGSSSFEIHDFNNDGHPDILYTCGDNADFSVIPKPYHGVYIYLNDGDNRFEKTWFYPQNGAYKALARDFDLDGDPDILSISFFPDPERHPGESLLYFRNDSDPEDGAAGNPELQANSRDELNIGLKFTPQLVRGAPSGRWINMHAGDLDGDGDTDIALASFTLPRDRIMEQYPGKWRNKPPFLLLENKTR